MTPNPNDQPPPVLLGIEAGATRTVAISVGSAANQITRMEFAGANLCLLSDAQLLHHLRTIAKSMPSPEYLGIGMAGARTPADHARILKAAEQVWPGVPCRASSDLETGLLAAPEVSSSGQRHSRRAASSMPRVLILSGTGSCCFGRTADGRTVRLGGWGHVLGDKGSGYEIGLRALKSIVHRYDCSRQWPALGQRVLRALMLNDPEDLVGWAQGASKSEIAALAVEVFDAQANGDKIAADVLNSAADTLAGDAVACARHVARTGTPVFFVLAGSVLLRQPRFAQAVGRKVRRLWPRAVVAPLKRESAWGAIELAKSKLQSRSQLKSLAAKPVAETQAEPSDVTGLGSLLRSPTEQRNPRSMNLDKLPLAAAVKLMIEEDGRIPKALLAQRGQITRGVQFIARSFKQGGRLIYVGAGTSGRLGALDASECPPTFCVSPEVVQAIMAGGQAALWSSIEGAEDDADAGSRAVEARGVAGRDTVVGIAASGRTPFVWGALREAKRRKARTVLVCFNPHLVVPRSDRPDLIIAPDVGPEILTGSTRLKSGTATKLVLNIFTTLAMVQAGKVRSNLMIDVKASNVKLRDRAVRILQALQPVDYATARAALERTDWKIKVAAARLSRSPVAR